MLDGYKYKFNRKTKDYILWLCNREKLYKCKARAKTDPDYKRLIEIIGDHKGHPPNKHTGKELEVGRSTFSVVVKPAAIECAKGASKGDLLRTFLLINFLFKKAFNQYRFTRLKMGEKL